jgi:antitoxin ParD1/3/4
MSDHTPITIGTYVEKFVDRQVKDGRYNSASDVVKAALRLFEEQEAHLEALRAALVAGEQSGTPVPFNIEEFVVAQKLVNR